MDPASLIAAAAMVTWAPCNEGHCAKIKPPEGPVGNLVIALGAADECSLKPSINVQPYGMKDGDRFRPGWLNIPGPKHSDYKDHLGELRVLALPPGDYQVVLSVFGAKPVDGTLPVYKTTVFEGKTTYAGEYFFGACEAPINPLSRWVRTPFSMPSSIVANEDRDLAIARTKATSLYPDVVDVIMRYDRRQWDR